MPGILRYWLTLATVAVLGVLAGVVPAGAATDVAVTTPAGGRYQPGSITPLLVTIRADGAVSGMLSVSFDGQSVANRHVEIPGGSERQIVMMVPTQPWASSPAVVTFDSEGQENDKTVQAPMILPGGDEIVGVFPELATRELPATASLAVDLGQARLYPIDVGLLDEGPLVLSPFSQIIVTPGDLDRLTEDRRGALEGWLAGAGGVLVIDAPSGTPVALPVAEGADGRYRLGLGSVRFSGGMASAGSFDAVFEPTMPRSAEDLPWGGFFFGGVPSSIQLARDAGVRVLAIGSLTLGLVLYTVVIGPVIWWVLRRGHREPVMWVAIPVLAGLTAAGVWIGGQQLREASSTAHASVIVDLPNSREIVSQVLVTSAGGGSEGVVLPERWHAVPSNDTWFWDPGSLRSNVIERDGRLLVDLAPGGVGVLTAETTQASANPSFALALRLEGDQLVGTVTNLTAHDLSEVMVSSGGGLAVVGNLAAGATHDITLRGLGQPPIMGDPLLERLLEVDAWSPNDGAANPGVLINWISRKPALRSPEFVFAVGWTRDEPGPLRTKDGLVVSSGRTAFATVVAADRHDTVSATTNQITYLRGYNGPAVFDVVAPGVCSDMPVTFSIRPGGRFEADDLPVVSIDSRSVGAFDIWDGVAWIPGQMAVLDSDPVIGLPPGALSTGQVYMRVQMTCDMWGMRDPIPKLRLATPDDTVIPLGQTTAGPANDATNETANDPEADGDA